MKIKRLTSSINNVILKKDTCKLILVKAPDLLKQTIKIIIWARKCTHPFYMENPILSV